MLADITAIQDLCEGVHTYLLEQISEMQEIAQDIAVITGRNSAENEISQILREMEELIAIIG